LPQLIFGIKEIMVYANMVIIVAMTPKQMMGVGIG